MNVRSLRAVESVIGPLEEESRSEVETLNDRVSKLEQQVRRLSAELGIDSEIS